MTDSVKDIMDSLYDWHLDDDKKLLLPKAFYLNALKNVSDTSCHKWMMVLRFRGVWTTY